MKEKLIKFIKMSNVEKKNAIKRYVIRKKSLLLKNISYIPSGYNKINKANNIGPKVSVLLPVYNHANVVNKSIKSILNQTYKNIELIILDDGSTDNLLDILKPYSKLENVKIYHQKNQKLPRSLTHLHKYATGDFITWTSADNIMHKKMIEVLVKKLMENPNASLVYGDVCVIDSKGKPFYGVYRDVDRDRKKPKIIRLLRNENPLKLANDNYVNASFLYRAMDSNVLNGIYADDIIGAEDYDFWLRLSKSGNIKHTLENKPYYYYRVHDNTMSHELQTVKIKIHQSRLLMLEKYEKERNDWCELRPNLLTSNLNQKNKNIIEKICLKLPVDVNNDNASKNIIFSLNDVKEKNYIKMDETYYYLVNDNKVKAKIYRGLNLPKEIFKARNLYSHSYYVDELFNIKKPIFGCHINSKKIDIQELKNLLAKNNSNYFIIIDEIFNEQIDILKKQYSNLIYYSNMPFGHNYQIYSNLARIFTLKSFTIEDKYRNLLLGFATGRKINYDNLDEFYRLYPYTLPYYNNTIIISHGDYIIDTDYEIMDKYIDLFSETGALTKIIKYYNSSTQESFIKRPKYEIDFIPEESEPELVQFDK